MSCSLPFPPHKLIMQFNKLTGGSTSDGADVSLNEQSLLSSSTHPPAIPSFISFSFPLSFLPLLLCLIYEQLQNEMLCLACMNIDGGETLIVAEFTVSVTFLESLLPAGTGDAAWSRASLTSVSISWAFTFSEGSPIC